MAAQGKHGFRAGTESRPYKKTNKKLIEYLLSEAHPVGKAKAQYFRGLGYRETNADLLKDGLKATANSNQVSETIRSPLRYFI